ncbi:MAG TPA: phage tail protein, partial [Micromonosporaceae bacterium]|nr:phage tail protein [Micromonosporaceae bacterium]
MREELSGLPVVYPIGERLPAIYAEDNFAQRMTSALDDVLSPVFVTLDCLPDYFDPILAPSDFVEWLSAWVAFSLDENWTLAQRRALVANAVELHRWRGTTRGLTSHVQLLTGGDVEIVDSGACTWSDRPGTPAPKAAAARVEVKVKVPDPRSVDEARLLSAIIEAVPAHVQVVLEVSVGTPQRGSGRASAGSARVSRSAGAVPASAGSAAVPPPAGSAAVPRPAGSAAVPPPAGSAAVRPPAGSAAVPPPAGSAAVPPPAGSAAVPPPAGAAGSAAVPQQPKPPPATGRAAGSARVRPPDADNDDGR